MKLKKRMFKLHFRAEKESLRMDHLKRLTDHVTEVFFIHLFQFCPDMLKCTADFFCTSIHNEKIRACLDWIPRIFRNPESMEISFLGLIPVIELLEIFKIDRIFFENSWIFSNKMVFETFFYMAFLAAWCRIDILYMFRILVIHCIEWSIWPTAADRGLGVITWFIDFTGVEIA